MFRNKLCLLICLCLPLASALAESPYLISEEMIVAETVNYSKTATIELGAYERDYNASASEFYPYTYTLATEVNNASFLKYHVARSQQVKAGDLLATFTLDVDEAATASARLSLERARKEYETGMQEKREAISEQLEALSAIRDPYERELASLRIQRAQVAFEQYCYQQDCTIAQLSEALSELEEANSSIHLYAPYDGTITALTYKREGERVYAGEGLVTMYREDGMLLRISNDQLYFRYGMPVTVTSGTKNHQKVFQGQVVAADNVLPQSRRQGYAYIQMEPFESEEKTRLTRLTVTGTSQSLQDIMVIPRRALTMDGGKYYVECLVNNTLQKRYVNLGLMTMSNAWVLQGLDIGDTIIID